jgi:uncharacterized protein YicC (UPF0701 family)
MADWDKTAEQIDRIAALVEQQDKRLAEIEKALRAMQLMLINALRCNSQDEGHRLAQLEERLDQLERWVKQLKGWTVERRS